ncbi:MAG: hypothetical protein JXB48_08240 [Candidatus Latescibacteria bacterium]|nr:hypothetical protein [Candidatus Latescibacterota bacterium]
MKNMLYTISLLIITCYFVVSSLMVEARDNDSDDMAKRYPPDRYLVRPGGGSSPENASEAARLEIAKYFESKISGESIVKEWAESHTVKGKTTQKHATELSNIISVSANREIPGIEITGTQQDKKTGEYTTWAVLEKNAYISVLKDRISKRDSETDQYLAGTGTNDMQKLRNLNRALQNLIEREKDRRDLTLLDPDSMVESRNNILQDVLNNIDNLVSDSFDVGLVFEGDVDSKVRTGITQGIVDAGIRIKEFREFSAACKTGNDLIMSVKHDVNEYTRNQKMGQKDYEFFYCSWVLSVSVYDPETTEVIDTFVQKNDIKNVGGGQAKTQDDMVRNILQNQVPGVTAWVYKLIFSPPEN